MNIKSNIEKFWHENGHLNEDQRDFLIDTLIRLKPKYCLEVGFATGRSTITILESARPEKLISIDINLDYMNARTHAMNLMRTYTNLTIYEGNSKFVLTEAFFKSEFPNQIDFAFIDGGHSYMECLEDISRIYPNLKTGGVMIVDDFKSGPPNGCVLPGVTSAVEDFCRQNNAVIEEWNKMGKGFAIVVK